MNSFIFQGPSPISERCCKGIQFTIDERWFEFRGPLVSLDDCGRLEPVIEPVNGCQTGPYASGGR